MTRLGGILIGLCIVIIAASLGLVLYVKLHLPLVDAGLSAALVALILLMLQGMATRARERAEFRATIDELRRANLAARDEIDRIGGRVGDIDQVGVRLRGLEQRVERGVLADLDARITSEVADAKASMLSEMQVIETLVRQLAAYVPPSEGEAGEAGEMSAEYLGWAEDLADTVPDVAPRGMAAEWAGPETPQETPAGASAPQMPDATTEPEAPATGDDRTAAGEAAREAMVEADEALAETEAGAEAEPARPDTPLGHLADAELLEMVREAVQEGRIDVHLQPIVGLPQRRARYYEALTRLRAADGGMILPADYIRVAEPAGLMPMIDNLLLFRSVQIIRRLAQRNREVGILCNISAHTLVDSEFFPQFVDFMQSSVELARAIVFELPQATVDTAGPLEVESLYALRDQGYRFSLDHVVDLDLDLDRLSGLGFRFVKIDAALLLDGARHGAQIHPADLSSLLARYGIELIAEKIENEATVVELIDFDVAFGQGYLFSEPRPVRGELMQEAGVQETVREAV